MNTITRALVAAALIFTPATSAHAEPQPIADNIVCFPHAIAPEKNGDYSISSISFGFKVHCTGEPMLRSVTTKLWRYDPSDGKYYVHSERDDTTTNPDVETRYAASCSNSGRIYQFHTEVIVNAFNGNWDRGSDNSPNVAATC